jgi:hypothetical protein
MTDTTVNRPKRLVYRIINDNLVLLPEAVALVYAAPWGTFAMECPQCPQKEKPGFDAIPQLGQNLYLPLARFSSDTATRPSRGRIMREVGLLHQSPLSHTPR